MSEHRHARGVRGLGPPQRSPVRVGKPARGRSGGDRGEGERHRDEGIRYVSRRRSPERRVRRVSGGVFEGAGVETDVRETALMSELLRRGGGGGRRGGGLLVVALKPPREAPVVSFNPEVGYDDTATPGVLEGEESSVVVDKTTCGQTDLWERVEQQQAQIARLEEQVSVLEATVRRLVEAAGPGAAAPGTTAPKTTPAPP